MALILLALGAVMSLVGLAAMITGYPSIEMERGWATVITGAVLLSGGLIVIALGMVVRHLIGLRHALALAGAPPQAAEVPVPQPMVVPTPLMPSMPAMPAASLPEALQGAPTSLAPAATAAVPAAAAALAAGAMLGHKVHDHHEAHEEHDARRDAEPEAHEPRIDAFDVDDHAEAAHEPPAAAHDNVLAHREANAFVDPAEVPPPAEVGHPKADRDLLDEAFSAFDYEMASGHSPATGVSADAAHEHHAEPPPAHPQEPYAQELPPEHDQHEHDPHEDAHAAYASEHAEPEAHPGDAHQPEPEQYPVEAPATAPAEPAANLTVIGRYDSEGTSYVMYSDGSIEAHSEAHVYRFGSMAELKAFIEG